ncbi:hypothetical protein CN172_26490 [Sinorhizobium meliloti]|uniref:hypothetical protein n=1 Tax=Rhizobium meliloti TaxID=382 RepID=UPI000FD86FCE|nr:hypothetical protein [Sinorhizobium meliloti]RVE97207.1 hypothetical protein CN232_22700 [Sinorhizobium meliloti]RVH40259.1 hypothetical protein CN208_25170 [Sinorhizobium meliloti]RVK07575.1 hypothetical protein CN172_26490 [Sinorhizobium meliloti]
MEQVQSEHRKAERTVNLMLRGARVTSTFREAVFDASSRCGMSVNEFVLTATAKQLVEDGKELSGIFRPGDLKALRQLHAWPEASLHG